LFTPDNHLCSEFCEKAHPTYDRHFNLISGGENGEIVKVLHFSHGPDPTKTDLAWATINAYHKLSNLYFVAFFFFRLAEPAWPDRKFFNS